MAYFSRGDARWHVCWRRERCRRALLWLVLPFGSGDVSKNVHAAAKSRKPSLFNLVVLARRAGHVAVRWLMAGRADHGEDRFYKSSYVAPNGGCCVVNAGAMVPLALANVMVKTDLLARRATRWCVDGGAARCAYASCCRRC